MTMGTKGGQYVAPVRERGLKFDDGAIKMLKLQGRSRKGAWIEIVRWPRYGNADKVAPVRERGLKYQQNKR